ncbi:hypothetical protein [Paenibacillus donghaensis]|uniref:Squalene cyclase C-terminal domain-containing protein n=1 Tax=Paenibacillus donghaensis TaxID=414771 RepID=A0A2Z2KG97_9BACL|nr:hypothetical protein [Paenibacillus donghaensis]ASA24857.1 hypothetical protein B9T62_31325 [Paenibacillus donghaensis]
MDFEKAERFIWRNGRLLERRIFEFVFHDGTKNNMLRAIKAYQNDDGGFGNAIEPDLRTPESQPLYTEFALRTLYDCNIKDAELANQACDYVALYADLSRGIPKIFPSSSYFPRAERISSRIYNDSHTILTAFCLLESLPQTDYVKELFGKLSSELIQANFFCLEARPQDNGLTPLDFSPLSNSYCRDIFSQTTINEHLKVMESQQEADGGYLIQWEPPGEMAKLEWRAHKTLKSLITLHFQN